VGPLLQLPLGPLRKLTGRRWKGARGSNMAFFRTDLERVDGFDGSYTGWGREDSDLFVRLIHSGLRRKDGRFATGVLHLWHPDNERSQLPQNEARLDQVLRSDRWRALQGLSTLDEPLRQDTASASPRPRDGGDRNICRSGSLRA
jgi:hypothetical protein